MPKSRRLSEVEITAFEARRDIGAEILQAILEIKAGKGVAVTPAPASVQTGASRTQNQTRELPGPLPAHTDRGETHNLRQSKKLRRLGV